MKKLVFLYVSLLLIIGCMFSCNKEAEKAVSPVDTISVTFGLDTTFVSGNDVKTGRIMKLSIKGEFPQNSVLRQEIINNCFSDSLCLISSNNPKEVIMRFCDYWLDDFKKIIEDEEHDNTWDADYPRESQYTLNVYRVSHLGNYLVSYCKEDDGYNFGAAHGYHGIYYFTFDLKNNKRITESSIFVDDYQKKINALLIKNMMEQYGADNASELLEKRLLLVDNENINSNDNFYISQEGITYCFNEYEISAYAAGYTKVTIPFYDLEGLIKESSPVYKYLKERY